MHRRTLLTALAASATLSGRAWSRSGRSEDMKVFRAAMAIHPGLLRYNTPAEIAGRLDAVERAYEATPSSESRYLILSRFLSSLNCGHSYCNFFNQKTAAVTALFDRPTRLPFYFEWLGDEMIVRQDFSGTDKLSPGTRVTSVNGLPVAQMLARLLPVSRADGHNGGKRRSLLSVQGTETIEFFDVFQGLLCPPSGDTHRLDVVWPDGRAGKVEVPMMTLKARQATITRVPEDSPDPRWTWTMRDDGIAVLDMPGWAMWNSPWKWEEWLEDRLDSLSGARGLIMDIRGNEGGDDCGNPLLRRLIDRPTQAINFVEKVRFETVPDVLAPHVSTWDEGFKSIGVGGRKLDDGFIERPARDTVPALLPSAKKLRVPVAALIGPANSSATFGFIYSARQTGRIKLFGRQTGGNLRGINGGGFFFTQLPQSGIEFDLPLVGYFAPTPQPDKGIDPDVLVAPTAQDIALGRDTAMDAAAAWIRTQPKA